jgi:hypothetical protein
MHRYDELEKLYYKNKIKKYLYVMMSLFIAVLILFWTKNTIKNKEKKPVFKSVNIADISDVAVVDSNISAKKEKNKTAKNTVKQTIKQTISEKTEKKHSSVPHLSFVLPHIDDTAVKTNKSANVKPENTKTKKSVSTQKTEKIQKQTTNNKKIVVFPVIKEQKIDVKQLIKSFNAEPKYDTAIVISKYYYNKLDLINAKLWALKANSINPGNYQSWKMFAMILIKKNDKIQAKKVLKTYLNDYGDNDEIKKLLRSIDE